MARPLGEVADTVMAAAEPRPPPTHRARSDFEVYSPLPCSPVVPAHVRQKVSENSFEPAPQPGRTPPGELRYVAARGEERLLDEVRRTDFRRQVGAELTTAPIRVKCCLRRIWNSPG